MRFPQLAAGLSAGLLLTACGGEGGAGATAGGTINVVPAPSPSPSSTPTPTPTQVSSVASPAGPLTDTAIGSFNFADGTAYPATPNISIEPATFKPGATEAFVRVALSAPAPTTVIAPVLTSNGSSGEKGIEGYSFKRVFAPVIFRPGDPLVQTVRIPLLSTKEGTNFSLSFVTTPQGANRVAGTASVTANSSVAATSAATGSFRLPRAYKATGTLQYEVTPTTLSFSDAGGTRTLSTKLSHGRSQPGNSETGIYLDAKLYPGVEAPVSVLDDAIVLHSQQLKTPIAYQGITYPHGASVLSGHATTAAQIGYGQYEWEARMTDRYGSWPALWLISTNGWPPEIDVYEGFGAASSWNFNTQLSHTIHGGKNNSKTYMTGVGYNATEIYGLSGFATGYHKYAVDIQPDFITWFVDGIETWQARNGYAGKRWYPIMNVAVKKTGDYSGGNGDMFIKSMRVYSN